MRLIYKRGRERIAFPLDEGETFIGRKDYCDIYFPDGSLSKRQEDFRDDNREHLPGQPRPAARAHEDTFAACKFPGLHRDRVAVGQGGQTKRTHLAQSYDR